MADSKEKLFSDFPAVSTEQWMEKITADLKGADFEKKLVWRTNEGFKVKPFYRQEDLEGLKTTEGLPGEFPYVRGTKKNDNTWFVRQEIKVECPKEANAKALDILNKGVDSLGFYVKKKDLSPEYIETLLNDICAECIELNFSTCQGHTVELAKLLVAYFQKKEYDLTKLQGSVNYDPMGKMMVKGKDLSNFITTAKELVEVLAPLPKFRCICVNAIELNNAGSYISQELGYALAWGNEYLSKLVEAGVPAALVAKKIKFNFGISSNYFLEIAKFRAARMLWADIDKIICWLEKAFEVAENEVQRAVIEKLIRFYKEGDLHTFDEYSILWVKDLDSRVDFVNGFILFIRVVPYDPFWEVEYENESQKIKNILKDILVEVYHIGSTAVKGLAAKSIIDIMPVVTNISLVDKHNKEFVAIGYECMGEFGIEGRRYFRKGGDNRTHQIHIFEQSNHKDINRHIAVRDFLRTHPDIALEYGELKMELAYRFSEDIEGYCTGKDAFVKQLEKDALLWYQNNESYKTR